MDKKIVSICSIVVLMILICTGCACTMDTPRIVGVWWWDSDLPYTYVDYAKDYGVNEIYYCDSGFDDDTADFIEYASSKGIKVYYLAGEWEWIYDATNLHTKIDKYMQYQEDYPDFKFSGIHLDIEPHQSTEWSGASDIVKTSIVQRFIDLVDTVDSTYTDISFQYDIPFWLDYEVSVDGYTKKAYEHMIDMADKVFIMSYRDTAEKIYDISKEEIEYASACGKSVVLGVETYSTEGDNVSFMEEGLQYMYSEIEKLKGMISKDTGICIHHMSKWYDMGKE